MTTGSDIDDHGDDHGHDDHGHDDHGHDDHGHDDHGHDDHGHAEEPLGPIDVAAWGAGVLGIALGLVVAVCFYVMTSGTG